MADAIVRDIAEHEWNGEANQSSHDLPVPVSLYRPDSSCPPRGSAAAGLTVWAR
jgi:hypothetical protein